MKKMKLNSVVVVCLIIWLVAIVGDWLTPYDDTDDIESGVRSGMVLYTDNLTGCQYLKGSFFAELTPRVNGKGRHIGCN